MSLGTIRDQLIKEEDCIVYSFFARSLYSRNSVVYNSDRLPISQSNGNGTVMSLLDSVLKQTEKLDALIHVYGRIETHPFFPEAFVNTLPPSHKILELPQTVHSINFNSQIYSLYIQTILQNLTAEGDDQDYAETVLADVQCLKALSRRAHLGKYVAEAKFQESPAKYTKLIEGQDREGILKELTDAPVEERVTTPFEGFAPRLCQTGFSELMAELYHDFLIPMTKEIEVEALLHRFERLSEDQSHKKF